MRPITGPQLCKKLEQAGWTLRRIKGSHHIYSKVGERKIMVVPVHGNEVVRAGLATKLAKDARLTW